MTYVGWVRLHFNRHGAAPLVWSVTTKTFELAVPGFYIDGDVSLETVYRPKATPDDEDGKPSAWLAPNGGGPVLVSIDEKGWAHIQKVVQS